MAAAYQLSAEMKSCIRRYPKVPVDQLQVFQQVIIQIIKKLDLKNLKKKHEKNLGTLRGTRLSNVSGTLQLLQ